MHRTCMTSTYYINYTCHFLGFYITEKILTWKKMANYHISYHEFTRFCLICIYNHLVNIDDPYYIIQYICTSLFGNAQFFEDRTRCHDFLKLLLRL